MRESETQRQKDNVSKHTERTDAEAANERIAELVSEAVPSGGGCTEAWEALSSLRSGENSSRRNFLKGMSAAGAGASLASLGIVPVEADAPQQADEPRVEVALDDNHVQSLLAALNEPEVITNRVAIREGSIGDLSITTTILPTAVGNIVHAEQPDGTTAAQYYFKTARAVRELPRKYRNIPQPDDAILTGQSDGVVLSRLATQREQQAMVQHLGGNPTEAIAFTTSEMEGFRLKFETEDGELNTVRIPVSESQVAYSEVTNRTFRQGTAEVVSSSSVPDANEDGISPAVNCGPDWCWRCVQGVGACGICYASCPVVGPGCAACIIALCGGGTWACQACIECS